MLDHVALEVADLARAARFYDALMHPLGGRRIVDSPDGIGYGRDRLIWIMPRDGQRLWLGAAAGRRRRRPALRATSRSPPPARRAVDAAHAAGARRRRPRRRRARAARVRAADYYSGYLVDPDGAWLELVSGSQ